MDGIRNGIENDAGAAEYAGALTDCACQAILVAFNFEWCVTFTVNLGFSFF
jgi:hypothetical protein